MIHIDPREPDRTAVPSSRNAQNRGLYQARKAFRAQQIAYFHTWLVSEVDRASPMFLDMCMAWRVDAEHVLRQFRPPLDWTGPDRKRRPRSWRPLPLHRARNRSADGDRMSPMLVDGSVEVRAWLGRGFLASGGGALKLWVPDAMPEIVQSSSIDRPLCDIIDHPLFRARHYPILASQVLGTGTLILASAPPVEYRVPWAT
ncbi:MAG: hypothetical protein KGJ57_19320 [Sphingomonadales bacterium]|nr:hypothetical protein [Sphingomonadales bacterium]MDE2171546.1 hypothetical protein [Sphingomonadales bacterium]